MNKAVQRRYGGQKKITRVTTPAAVQAPPVPTVTPIVYEPLPVAILPRYEKPATERAIFWICSGEHYIKEARLSARSVEKHMPGLWRILYTPDAGVEAGKEFDELRMLPPRIHAKRWFLESTHYLGMVLPELPEYLVWATGDTYCCNPFDFVFGVLKKYDWATTPMPGNICSGSTAIPVPANFPEPTICVMGLHNTKRLQKFVPRWYEHYREHQDMYTSDQPALRAMLWEYRKTIKLFTMPREWLSILAISNDLDGTAYWLHGRPGTKFTYQEAGLMGRWAEEVNSMKGPRVWRPGRCESR